MEIGRDYNLKKSLHELAFKKVETIEIKSDDKPVDKPAHKPVDKPADIGYENLTEKCELEDNTDYTPFLEQSEGKQSLVFKVANKKHFIFDLPKEIYPITSDCFRKYFDDPARFYTLVKLSPKRIALFSKSSQVDEKKRGFSLLFHLGINDTYKVKVKENNQEILQEKKYEFICTTIIKYTYAKDKPKKLKVYLVTLTTDLKIRLFDIMGLLNMKKTFSVESADHIEFEKIVEFEEFNTDKNVRISEELNEEDLKISDPRINRSKKKQKEISITLTNEHNKDEICIERKYIGGPQKKTDRTRISILDLKRVTDQKIIKETQ